MPSPEDHRLRAPTIIDVARVSGVSKSTISRVINGVTSVQPETVERVRHAMSKLGYQTNQAARSLRTRKTELVGVIVPSLNEIYGQQAEAVDGQLQLGGISTVISCFGWSVERCLETMHNLIARGVDGLVMSLPDDRDPRIVEAVTSADVPLVLLDREVAGAMYDAVLTDQSAGVSDAILHLKAVGRSKIGLIAMSPRTRPGRAAVAAYAGALTANGFEYSPPLVVQTDQFTNETGRESMAYLLTQGVDAVIAATPMVSLAGVMAQLADAGVSYPRDISLVGFHEHELSLAKYPRLSVITRSVRNIGVISGDLIVERLADPSGPAIVRTVPTWFSLGESSDPQSAPR